MWVRGKNERGLVISQLPPPPILPSSSPSTHHTACSSSVLHGFLTQHLTPLPWLLHVVLHSHFSRFLQRSSNRRPATFFGYVKSWVTGARDEEGDEDLEETDGARNGGAAMAQAQAQSAPPAASASVAATRHTGNGIAASSAAPQTEMAAKVRVWCRVRFTCARARGRVTLAYIPSLCDRFGWSAIHGVYAALVVENPSLTSSRVRVQSPARRCTHIRG
jgi:hypothetical protein